jgi:hypothetical protein
MHTHPKRIWWRGGSVVLALALAGRAAAVLDLQHGGARPDRLHLAADRRRRAVSRVEADQRRGRDPRGPEDHDKRSARYAMPIG